MSVENCLECDHCVTDRQYSQVVVERCSLMPATTWRGKQVGKWITQPLDIITPPSWCPKRQPVKGE